MLVLIRFMLKFNVCEKEENIMVRKLKALICLATGVMFGLNIDFGQFMYSRLGISYMLIEGAITLACFYAGIHFLFPYPEYIKDDKEIEDNNNPIR